MTSMQFVCKDTESSRCTYEAHAFEQIAHTTSKRDLLKLLSAWVQEHSLLHEQSDFVADSIRLCVDKGVFVIPKELMRVEMRSAADSQQLGLNVKTHAGYGPCEVMFGTLDIATAVEPGTDACPAYTFAQDSSSLKTSVQGFRVQCMHDAVQQGAESRHMPKYTRTTPESHTSTMTRCRSHRDYRIKCKQVHDYDRDMVSFGNKDVFSNLTTLTHDISVLSTRALVSGVSAAVHTVVFKC